MFGEDFGQKVDLTASIRSILRNYPEGTAILKELAQNADDAGASTIRFILDHRFHRTDGLAAESLAQFQGPSLLVYNDAVFTEEDLKSIQRIGDSLKNLTNESKTKIGRFGIGFNAVYHLSELPSFISDHFMVMLDPSAKYLPNVNPSNPGKLIDWLKDKSVVTRFPGQFAPYVLPGKHSDWNKSFPGTLFRLPLRTESQAAESSMSKRVLDVVQIHEVLRALIEEAPAMLLFLRRVEKIEICEWRPACVQPEMLFAVEISNVTSQLRAQRGFDELLGANRATNISRAAIGNADYTLNLRCSGPGIAYEEVWRVCSQFGGGQASQIARQTDTAHLKLVPIAGVAACLSSTAPNVSLSSSTSSAAAVASSTEITGAKSGRAYCFLPLPIDTQLPVMINGFFELSSNRRDIWQASADMAGDGSTRARWNAVLLTDVVSPCYLRLLRFSRDQLGSGIQYESLWPTLAVSVPWNTVSKATLALITNEPMLAYENSNNNNKVTWIEPSKAIVAPLEHALLLENDGEGSASLYATLQHLRLQVVRFQRPALHEALVRSGCCATIATAAYLREALRLTRQLPVPVTLCRFLVHYALSDLTAKNFVSELADLPIAPLRDGTVGVMKTFSSDQVQALDMLLSMRYTMQESLAALSLNRFDVSAAIERLSDESKRMKLLSPTSATGRSFFVITASDEDAEAFAAAAPALLDSRALHPADLEFFLNPQVQRQINLRVFTATLVRDLLQCILPPACLSGNMVLESSLVANQREVLKTFGPKFWRFAAAKPSFAAEVAESYALLPVDGAIAWYPLSKLSNVLCPVKAEARLTEELLTVCRKLKIPLLDVDSLGGLDVNTLPKQEFWDYVAAPSRSGLLTTIAFVMRTASTREVVNRLLPVDYDLLRAYFMEGPLTEFSDPQQGDLLASIPMFRVVVDQSTSASSAAAAAAATDAVTSNVSYTALFPKKSSFVTLPSFDAIPHVCLFPGLVLHDSPLEQRLVSFLGVKNLKWTGFYTQFVMKASSIYSKDQDAYKQVVVKMLQDLPQIAKEDNNFVAVLRGSVFLPSATGQLMLINHLYDPSNPEIVALMESAVFPSARFASLDLLAVLKSLGLRTIIDWRGVLECAISIEQLSDEDEAPKLQRSGNLLGYLNVNILRLTGEEKKVPPKPEKSKSTFSLFANITSIFDTSSNLSAPQDNKICGLTPAELEQSINALRRIKWMPALKESPDPLMPWPTRHESLCSAPVDSATINDAWLCSASKRIVQQPVKEQVLLRVLGWDGSEKFSGATLAAQLLQLSRQFKAILATNATEEQASMRQRLSVVVSQLYERLGKSQQLNDARSILEGAAWIWVGGEFVPQAKVALNFSVNAAPYLYQLPSEIKTNVRLFEAFSFRQRFSFRDYIEALREMAVTAGYVEGGKLDAVQPLPSASVDAAVALVALIASEGQNALQAAQTIFVPDVNCKLVPANLLVIDDIPWETGDQYLAVRASSRLCHSSIASAVAEKVGVQSLRLSIVSRTMDTNLFGDDGTSSIQAYGQAESITNRIKTILDLYPEGSPILNELIQNADDAGATVVKIIIDENHYGTESLLDKRMEPLQGPALIFQNNAKFSEADFRHLASIAQNSKLDKLATTGRFGLGFNSTMHLTDTPQIISGDAFIMLDAHCKYVPGAKLAQPGIKFKYTDSNLDAIFPDQFAPFKHCDFDFSRPYEGTIFRFPLRTEQQARTSEISNRHYRLSDLETVVSQFVDNLSRVVLFLRNVQRVEVYRCQKGSKIETLLYSATAQVSNRRTVNDQGLLDFFDKRAQQAPQQNVNYSKEAFYAKLSATNDNTLPRVFQTKQVVVENYITDVSSSLSTVGAVAIAAPTNASNSAAIIPKRMMMEFEMITGLCGGRAKRIACSEEARSLKLVPLGGVAACTARVVHGSDDVITTLFPSVDGQAFCFLPLPINTQLPVLINAYFELSSNRRDIWRGEDTAGQSKLRSDWNDAILVDVVAVLYAALLDNLLMNKQPVSNLASSHNILQLLPLKTLSTTWQPVKDALIPLVSKHPMLWSKARDGIAVSLSDSFLLEQEEIGKTDSKVTKRLEELLIADGLSIVAVGSDFISWLAQSIFKSAIVNPAFIRRHFHVKLGAKQHQVFTSTTAAGAAIAASHAAFLLHFALQDIQQARHQAYFGLRLLPLQSGDLAAIEDVTDAPPHYLVTPQERKLLELIPQRIVADDEQTGADLNKLLLDPVHVDKWNIRRVDDTAMLKLVGEALPARWSDSKTHVVDRANHLTDEWLGSFWRYLVAEKRIELYMGVIPLVPILSPKNGEDEKKFIAKIHRLIPIIHYPTRKRVQLDPVVSGLWKIGVYVLDDLVARSFLNNTEFCRTVIKSQDAAGILEALSSVNNPAAKAASLSPSERIAMQSFILDEVLRNIPVLQETHCLLLLSLPIWLVHDRSKERIYPLESTWEALDDAGAPPLTLTALNSEVHRIPPVEIPSELLDAQFVVFRSDRDRPLYEKLGLKAITSATFVATEMLPKIERENVLRSEDQLWLSKFILRKLTQFSEVPGLLDTLAKTKFIQNDSKDTNKKEWCRPSDLYDLDVPILSDILPEHCFPNREEYREPTFAHNLRRLGLRREINADGILRATQSIEDQQKRCIAEVQAAQQEDQSSVTSNNTRSFYNRSSMSIESHEAYPALLERCQAVLRYLESHVDTLLKEVDDEGLQRYRNQYQARTMRRDVSSTASAAANEDERESGEQPLGKQWGQMLRSTFWLSALMKPPVLDQHRGLPFPQKVHSTCFAAPMQCTSKANIWAASATMRIAAIEVVNPLLVALLGWSKPIGGSAVAAQLVNLAADYMILQTEGDSNAMNLAKTKYDEIFVTLLNKLMEAYQTEHESEINLWLRSLVNKPVIWTNSGTFIEANRVALTPVANANVEPFLYIAPQFMHRHRELLLKIGVHERFEPADLANLTRQLYNNYKDQSLPIAAQIDIFAIVKVMADLMLNASKDDESREEGEEDPEAAVMKRAQNLIHQQHALGTVYLLDRTGVLRPANQLTYNDAAWIPQQQASRFQHIRFLSERIDNRNGALLGCKSFRELLFAGENVFCPNSRAVYEQIASCNLIDTMNDIMAMADVLDCGRVHIYYDGGSYGSESLLHPGLTSTQGTALLFHLVARELSTEEISRMLNIGNPMDRNSVQYMTAIGRRLLSAFAVADCLQVLSGSDFYIFDPSSQFLVNELDDSASAAAPAAKVKASSTAETEGRAQHFSLKRQQSSATAAAAAAAAAAADGSSSSSSSSLLTNFADQFAPYCNLSVHTMHELTERGKLNGSIIRLPLRLTPSAVSEHVVTVDMIKQVYGSFKAKLSGCLLFANTLSSVDLSHREENDSEMIFDLGLEITDLATRQSRLSLHKNTDWEKRGSISASLMGKTYIPPQLSYKLGATLSIGTSGWMHADRGVALRIQLLSDGTADGSETAKPVISIPEQWQILACMGFDPLRDMALAEPFKRLKLPPMVSIALPLPEKWELERHDIDVDEGMLCHLGTVIDATGLPFHVEARFISVSKGSAISAKSSTEADQICQTWNSTVVSTALNVLYIKFLLDYITSVQEQRPPHAYSDLSLEGYYKYWIYKARLSSFASDAVDNSHVLVSLAAEKVFLQGRGFVSAQRAIFPATVYSPAMTQYLRSTVAMLRTPNEVSRSLATNRHIVPPIITLTAARFRVMCKKDANSHMRKLTESPRSVLLALLAFSLSDFNSPEFRAEGEFTKRNAYSSLRGCPLLPTADGNVGFIPLETSRRVAYAAPVVYSVLPGPIKQRMIRPELLDHIPLLRDPIFQEAIGLSEISPLFLRDMLGYILPVQLLATRGIIWVDNFDQQTDAFDSSTLEKLLYCLWNLCFHYHNMASLLELGEVPLLPAVSSGRRLLLPVSSLQLIFTPQVAETEEKYRAQLKSQVESAVEAYDINAILAEDGSGMTEEQKAAWLWTTKGIDTIDRPVKKDLTYAGRAAVVPAAVAAPAVPVEPDGLPLPLPPLPAGPPPLPAVAMAVPPPILPAAAAVVEAALAPGTLAALKKVGAPFLDTLIFASKPLAMQASLHVGRKILDSLHAFHIDNPLLLNLVGASINQEERLPTLDFANMTFNDRLELLQQIHTAHRAQAFDASMLNKLRQLPLFTNIVDRTAVALEECKKGVFWCRDAAVIATFGSQILSHSFPVSSASASTASAAAVADPAPIAAPIAASSESPVILQHSEAMTEIYRWLNIEELTPTKAIVNFVLPNFDNMNINQRLTFIDSLVDNWNAYKTDQALIDVLKTKKFIPMWDHDQPELWQHVNVNDFESLRACNAVFLWTNVELLVALQGVEQPRYYAPPSLRTERLLPIFKTLGMSEELTADSFERIATGIQKSYDSHNNDPILLRDSLERGRRLIRYLLAKDRMMDLLDNTRFAQRIGKVRFVPANVPVKIEEGGFVVFRQDLVSYSHLVSKSVGALACSVLPILEEDLAPQHMFFSQLGIAASVTTETALKHMRNLTQSESLDRWNMQYGIEETFTALFAYLAEKWSSFSAQITDTLKSVAIIPIGTVLAPPQRVFFRLSEDLSPFMYELPRAFGAQERWLRLSLGVRETPAIGDLLHFLHETKNELRDQPLNPNELRAITAILTQIATQVENGNDRSDLQLLDRSEAMRRKLCVPDEQSRLQPVDNCLINDDAVLTRRVRNGLAQRGLFLIHPLLNASSTFCRVLRVLKLSEVVTERLSSSHPCVQSEEQRLQSQVRELLSSHPALLPALQRLLPTPVSIQTLHNAINTEERLSFRFVSSLNSSFVIRSPSSTSSIDELGLESTRREQSTDNNLPYFLEKVDVMPSLSGDSNASNSSAFAPCIAWINVTELTDDAEGEGSSLKCIIALCLCKYLSLPLSTAALLTSILQHRQQPKALQRLLYLYRVDADNNASQDNSSENNQQEDQELEWLLRGEPGSVLTTQDSLLIEIKPLRLFRVGEAVAISLEISSTDSNQKMVYGRVLSVGEANEAGLRFVEVRVGPGTKNIKTLLSSEIFAFRSARRQSQMPAAAAGSGNGRNGVSTSSSLGGMLKQVSNNFFSAGPTSPSDKKGSNQQQAVAAPAPVPTCIVPAVATAGREDTLKAVDSLLRRAGLPLSLEQQELMGRVMSLEAESKRLSETLRNERNDIATQRQSMQEDSGRFKCAVCLSNIVDRCLVPCGHTLCSACCAQLRTPKKCPYDRKNVTAEVPLFFGGS